MSRISIPILLVVAAAAQTQIDDPDAYQKLRLKAAGVAINDEVALIRTLHQPEKPWLAAYAARLLGRLPKSDIGVRELNAAALSEHEWLFLYAMESLIGWGDRQWVSIARSRLPKYKEEAVRLSVAGLLARVGIFDGWNVVESDVMGNARYRYIGLGQVTAFRDMKELSGQPFDLLKKLDSMRSNSSNKALRDRLLEKIIQLTRQPPVQSVPRK